MDEEDSEEDNTDKEDDIEEFIQSYITANYSQITEPDPNHIWVNNLNIISLI